MKQTIVQTARATDAPAGGEDAADPARALEAARARVLEAEAEARREAEARLDAERRAREKAAEAAALRRAYDKLAGYGRDLERRHRALLESETWRAMEPARRLIRAVRRRKAPARFVPRLEDLGDDLFGGTDVTQALRLETKLWGGFADRALRDLEALKADPDAAPALRAEAAWAVARRHAARDEPAAALENVALMAVLDPAKRLDPRRALLEGDCLVRLGRPEEARARLAEALARAPEDPHLHLAMANAQGEDAVRLDWINRVLARAGLAPLAKRDPGRPLGIDNLHAPAAAAGSARGPKVSVILPAFRAAATLPAALEGLLAQTWAALEILVVDDASPDGTAAVAEGFARRDPRVKVIRRAENGGGYAARNAGLLAAAGAFVTTHDADDWSHPRKIEIQVRHLTENPKLAACFSDWARVSPDLRAGWLFRAWGGLVAKNMSSILLRRAAMDALGGWDTVRVGADTDLLRRAERLFGRSAIGRAAPGVPLAFGRHEAGSLTRQSATHVRTMLHGPRREYDEAGAYWRGNVATRADLRLPPDRPEGAPRPFPAPPSLLAVRGARTEVDLLFVSDFCMRGGAFVSTFNYMEAARAAGLRVGLLHWRRYDLDVTQPLNPQVRALAQAGGAAVVSPGEAARAEAVIVGYPAVLAEPMDLFPEIEHDELIVVVNQMASRLHGGEDPQYDPEAVRTNLRALFGREGIWAPISGLVARLMRADGRYPEPSATVWTPLIDVETWCAAPPRWRGGGAPPVVGRHARDHYTKWPTSAAALRAAYCADRPCAVEIMGGAERAFEVIGARPANWTVHRFGAMAALPFLRRLDFFVHYPHEDYIEEFGRAALEALAAGVPAVLPPVFRESFGEAAVYAEPHEVWDRIEALWRDEAAYLAQARRGRDFVRANSDWRGFPDRLARTIGASHGGARAPSGA